MLRQATHDDTQKIVYMIHKNRTNTYTEAVMLFASLMQKPGFNAIVQVDEEGSIVNYILGFAIDKTTFFISDILDINNDILDDLKPILSELGFKSFIYESSNIIDNFDLNIIKVMYKGDIGG
jgi:hypothetical protein